MLKRLTIIASLAFFALPASAAELYFGAQTTEVGVGSTLEIGVMLNTEGEMVNAIEGDVRVPAGAVVTQVLDAGSVVSFWIESPALQGDVVHFAGIVPGGIETTGGRLFSLVVTFPNAGRAVFSTANEQVLLNDGNGTATTVRRAPLTLSVTEAGSTSPFLLPTDTDEPEPFTPIVARDPNLFDNRWFVSFATQDKISGIDHYEVTERVASASVRSWWQSPSKRVAVSPAPLEDQSLRSEITVVAVDRAGNRRQAEISPAFPVPWYETKPFWGIMLAIVMGILAISLRKLWGRGKK